VLTSVTGAVYGRARNPQKHPGTHFTFWTYLIFASASIPFHGKYCSICNGFCCPMPDCLNGSFSWLGSGWSFHSASPMKQLVIKRSCGVGSGAVTFSPRKPAGLSPVFGWNFASSNAVNATCLACLKPGKTAVKGHRQGGLGFIGNGQSQVVGA
jgi:hypothetical protein